MDDNRILVPEVYQISMPGLSLADVQKAINEQKPHPFYYYQEGFIKISDKPISVTITLDKSSYGH